jgi:hypothetical protein
MPQRVATRYLWPVIMPRVTTLAGRVIGVNNVSGFTRRAAHPDAHLYNRLLSGIAHARNQCTWGGSEGYHRRPDCDIMNRIRFDPEI